MIETLLSEKLDAPFRRPTELVQDDTPSINATIE